MPDYFNPYFFNEFIVIIIIDSRLINKVMQSILKNHSIKEECEITIEANPDDITDKNIKSWKKIGFNMI